MFEWGAETGSHCCQAHAMPIADSSVLFGYLYKVVELCDSINIVTELAICVTIQVLYNALLGIVFSLSFIVPIHEIE